MYEVSPASESNQYSARSCRQIHSRTFDSPSHPQIRHVSFCLFQENSSPGDYLREMQCMWFELEMARSHRRLKKYGEALKKCHEIDRVTTRAMLTGGACRYAAVCLPALSRVHRGSIRFSLVLPTQNGAMCLRRYAQPRGSHERPSVLSSGSPDCRRGRRHTNESDRAGRMSV